MILYIEKKYADNLVAQHIAKQYPNASLLWVDNYKNIFDISLAGTTDKTLIIAGVNNAISEAPK